MGTKRLEERPSPSDRGSPVVSRRHSETRESEVGREGREKKRGGRKRERLKKSNCWVSTGPTVRGEDPHI